MFADIHHVQLAMPAGREDEARAFFVGVLGMAVDVAADDGTSLRESPGMPGELVCREPFPSMPLGFWGDQSGERYHAAYFARFPEVWAHGDFASWTEHGGMVIHGRSDARSYAKTIEHWHC